MVGDILAYEAPENVGSIYLILDLTRLPREFTLILRICGSRLGSEQSDSEMFARTLIGGEGRAKAFMASN